MTRSSSTGVEREVVGVGEGRGVGPGTAGDELAARVWTRERARREGVSVARLTVGEEFTRVVPGAYVETCWAEDLPTRCAAVLTRAPHGVLSHWTALQVHGLPGPVRRPDLLHLTVGDGEWTPRWSGVTVHRTSTLRVFTTPRGLRVTGVDRAWCDSAALASGVITAQDPADLLAVGDALLARRPAVAREIASLLGTRTGGRGVALARAVLAELDARAESAMESRLRWVLRDGGLPAPDVQHEVRDDRGGFVARVDLAYPQARLAVEYDGDHHRAPGQWGRDLRRRERLEGLGWRVVVVTANDLLRHPQEVVARVHRALVRPTPERVSG